MPSRRFYHFVITASLAFLASQGLFSLATFADCKANYNQSVELLNANIGKTRDKLHPTDPDAFETSFRDSVQKLQTEKCLPELMSLIQHIQGEQQKYPHPKTKPAPITD